MKLHSTAIISLLAIGVTGLGWQLSGHQPLPMVAGHQTVLIKSGTLDYRPSGEFQRAGLTIPAPKQHVTIRQPLEIMKYQVTVGAYLECVRDGACKPLDKRTGVGRYLPATGISYLDATAYAAWLTHRTGDLWRLPTDAEWSYAAAEKYHGDLFAGGEDPDNPATAWIGRYREEAASRREPDPHPKPSGAYGLNSFGLADFSGNVWEWTSDCYLRVTLEPESNSELQRVENCGVHVMGGRHRTYMSDFIRDGKSGGCAVGSPPDNLGFRLIREPARGMAGLWRSIRNLAG